MFEEGQEVYGQDGRKAIYVETTNTGRHVVTPVFREDGDEVEGEQEVWQAVYADPPVPVLHRKVEELKAEAARIAASTAAAKKEAEEARKEALEATREAAAARKELADAQCSPELVTLAGILSGKLPWILEIREEYGWCRGVWVHHIVDGQYHKLASAVAMVSGGPLLTIEGQFFATRAEAVAAIPAALVAGLRACKDAARMATYLDVMRKYNLPVDPETLQIYQQMVASEAEKAATEAEARVVSAKADAEKARAKATAAAAALATPTP